MGFFSVLFGAKTEREKALDRISDLHESYTIASGIITEFVDDPELGAIVESEDGQKFLGLMNQMFMPQYKDQVCQIRSEMTDLISENPTLDCLYALANPIQEVQALHAEIEKIKKHYKAIGEPFTKKELEWAYRH